MSERDLDWNTAMRVADGANKYFADQHAQLVDRAEATSLTLDEVRAIGARSALLAKEGADPQGAAARGSSGASGAGVGTASAGAATAPDRSRTPRCPSKSILPGLPVVVSALNPMKLAIAKIPRLDEVTGMEDLTALSQQGGTAVILSCRTTTTNGPQRTVAQFQERGFTPIMVYGPDTRQDERFAPYHYPKSLRGSTNVAHLAYHHTFWPVLEDMLVKLGAGAWLVFAEDSCMLMDQTTPGILFELANRYKRALWCGYCNKPLTKYTPTLTPEGDLSSLRRNVKVPYGTKLLVVNLSFVRAIRHLMMLTDITWFADQHLEGDGG